MLFILRKTLLSPSRRSSPLGVARLSPSSRYRVLHEATVGPACARWPGGSLCRVAGGRALHLGPQPKIIFSKRLSVKTAWLLRPEVAQRRADR